MDDTGGAGGPGGLGGPGRRGRYHHGDLRAALVEGGLELLASGGLAGFSVAELARRVGVSTAAPYRHFADRDHLLAAVAARIAAELAETLRIAMDGAGPDDGDRLAAAAGAYVVFVMRRGVGFDLVFAPDLRAVDDHELAEAGRAVMVALLAPARGIEPDPTAALSLLEQVVTLAHGYAALDARGFLSGDRLSEEATSVRATRAAAALVRGHRAAPS